MERQPYWCWLCQRPRANCGGENGSCPAVDASAAEYRDDLENGRVKTMFKTRRLAAEREYGLSQSEMAKETVEAAKRDGREIESVAAYGEIKNQKVA